MKNVFLGYQMNMTDTKVSISDALQRYYEKFGLPPQVLEVSHLLKEVPIPIPDGMKLVVKVHRMPINILLIGDEHETQKIPLQVEKK